MEPPTTSITPLWRSALRALTPHIVNLFDMDAKCGDVMSLASIEQYLESLPACREG